MTDFWDRFKDVVRSEWNSRFTLEDGEDGHSAEDLEDVEAALRRERRASRADSDASWPGVESAESAYRLLDLLPGVSLEDVRRTYFELARHYYPLVVSGDKDRATNARSVLFSLTEAYEVLCETLLPLSAPGSDESVPQDGI